MSERAAEGVAYAVAAIVLIVGGMRLPSQLLNWIAGPATVVVTVSVLIPLLTSKRQR